MSSPVDPNNISLLAFMSLSREENLTTQSLDDLVDRLGTLALAELKVLTALERSRLRFDLRRFEPVVSEKSSFWLKEMLTSNETTEAKESATTQRKADEALKAEFERGLQIWLETEQSKCKHEAAQRIGKTYDSNATELVLSDLELTSLPPEIGQLTNLKKLYLNINKLRELPPTFDQLTNLQKLDLNFNKLRELSPTFEQLTNLQKLDLNFNRLTEFPPSLGQLTNLQNLDLCFTGLRELPPSLGQLTNLQQLVFNDNYLSELPVTFGQLTNLQGLYLGVNHFSEFPAILEQLTNLKVLHLAYNQLKELPATLRQLTNLQWLGLRGNHFSEFPSTLLQLTNLKALYLSYNQLTKLPPSLGHLTTLRTLDLGVNHFSELPSTLGQLTKLKQLYLKRNQLTKLPATFGQLTNLRSLNLAENKLTELPATLGQLYKLENLTIKYIRELSDLPLSLGNIAQLTVLETDGTNIPEATREAILEACKSARARESHKKLPQTIALWKTKAGSQNDLSFLTNDPILSAEKLGGMQEVAHSEASGPLNEGSLRVRMNDHLFDFTVDELSELWKIQKGSLLSKLQEGTYLEEGSFSRHQQAILYEWLVRLSKTSDYSHSQKPLAERVCQILTSLNHNPEFRERFFILADANNERCGDRAAMSLNEIYTAYLLSNLPKEASTEDQLKLLVGLAKTYTLRETLARLMETQTGLEESVEIFLAKETTLNKRLGLVTAVETMLYERIGQREWLNDDDLVETVNANFFDRLFDFGQFQKLMKEDPSYHAQEQGITKKFALQMDELEKNINKMVEQDYVVKGTELSQQKETALKELARIWIERKLHV